LEPLCGFSSSSRREYASLGERRLGEDFGINTLGLKQDFRHGGYSTPWAGKGFLRAGHWRADDAHLKTGKAAPMSRGATRSCPLTHRVAVPSPQRRAREIRTQIFPFARSLLPRHFAVSFIDRTTRRCEGILLEQRRFSSVALCLSGEIVSAARPRGTRPLIRRRPSATFSPRKRKKVSWRPRWSRDTLKHMECGVGDGAGDGVCPALETPHPSPQDCN
jgi:hypothetical protein